MTEANGVDNKGGRYRCDTDVHHRVPLVPLVYLLQSHLLIECAS